MNFKERAKELVSKMTLAEKMSQMKHAAPAIERLGIPAYNWWNEGLHGVARTGAATVFPQAIGMAATFNDEKLQKVGDVISTEARAKYNEYKQNGETKIYQGLTIWSPNINIFRDPRWGRGHETYGEDPYLTGRMGAAFINGIQGDGKYKKADATIKHYAVHSGPEDLRHGFDAQVSDKDLFETYLWAFKYCIDNAKPSAVMGAYNRINGEAACASETYLKNLLIKEWGFDGYVVSDCGAICDINKNHHITENEAESAALAVKNGCDLNCGDAYKWLKTSVALGLLDEETITASVERLFEARFRLGMFDNDCEYDNIPYDVIECDEHIKLSREMAQESMVLLKNDGILPLPDNKKIAVIGPVANEELVLIGNYNGTPTDSATLLRGINERNRGKTYYSRGSNIALPSNLWDMSVRIWDEHPMDEAILAAKRADIVIFCMGITPKLEGEEGDTYSGVEGFSGGDKKTIEIPKVQMDIFREVAKLNKPMVFVSVSGSCMNLSEPDEKCNAVIQCFYPGAEGGRALADVLFGDVSPSGRLPLTFYKSVDDIPPFEDYSMENRTYKFFKGETVYNFGHGLTYSEISENWLDESTVEISNTGKYDTAYSVLKFKTEPHKELVDFKKIFIKQGETITVKF